MIRTTNYIDYLINKIRTYTTTTEKEYIEQNIYKLTENSGLKFNEKECLVCYYLYQNNISKLKKINEKKYYITNYTIYEFINRFSGYYYTQNNIAIQPILDNLKKKGYLEKYNLKELKEI